MNDSTNAILSVITGENPLPSSNPVALDSRSQKGAEQYWPEMLGPDSEEMFPYPMSIKETRPTYLKLSCPHKNGTKQYLPCPATIKYQLVDGRKGLRAGEFRLGGNLGTHRHTHPPQNRQAKFRMNVGKEMVSKPEWCLLQFTMPPTRYSCVQNVSGLPRPVVVAMGSEYQITQRLLYASNKGAIKTMNRAGIAIEFKDHELTRTITDNEPFLIFDGRPEKDADGERDLTNLSDSLVWVFRSETALAILKKHGIHIQMDTTFKFVVVPKEFKMLLNVVAELECIDTGEKAILWVAGAFMKSSSEDCYGAAIKAIFPEEEEFNLGGIMVDYELAQFNQLHKRFPDTPINFCSVHLARNAKKMMMQEGLLRGDKFPQAAKALYLLTKLAYLPSQYIKRAWQMILRRLAYLLRVGIIPSQYETPLVRFALRHWPVYISNSSRYDKRHWSVFERILAGHTHCTNGVEGIHHHLNTLLPRRGIATCDGFQELRLLEDKTRRQHIRSILPGPKGYVPMLKGSKKRLEFSKMLREMAKEFSELEKPEDSDIRGFLNDVRKQYWRIRKPWEAEVQEAFDPVREEHPVDDPFRLEAEAELDAVQVVPEPADSWLDEEVRPPGLHGDGSDKDELEKFLTQFFPNGYAEVMQQRLEKRKKRQKKRKASLRRRSLTQTRNKAAKRLRRASRTHQIKRGHRKEKKEEVNESTEASTTKHSYLDDTFDYGDTSSREIGNATATATATGAGDTSAAPSNGSEQSGRLSKTQKPVSEADPVTTRMAKTARDGNTAAFNDYSSRKMKRL